MSAVGWTGTGFETPEAAAEERVTRGSCTQLLEEDEVRLVRRQVAVAMAALQEISLCNDGKGAMPERAQRAYGLLIAMGQKL